METGPCIIEHASKTLTAEKRYSKLDKETYALMWDVERFRYYNYKSKPFTLITDSNPIQLLFTLDYNENLRTQR